MGRGLAVAAALALHAGLAGAVCERVNLATSIDEVWPYFNGSYAHVYYGYFEKPIVRPYGPEMNISGSLVAQLSLVVPRTNSSGNSSSGSSGGSSSGSSTTSSSTTGSGSYSSGSYSSGSYSSGSYSSGSYSSGSYSSSTFSSSTPSTTSTSGSSSSGARRLRGVEQPSSDNFLGLEVAKNFPNRFDVFAAGDDSSTASSSSSNSSGSADFTSYTTSSSLDTFCEGQWALIMYNEAIDQYYYPYFVSENITSVDCASNDTISALSNATWTLHLGSTSTENATIAAECFNSSEKRYSIDIISANGDETYRSYFADAAARWSEIIVGDLPGYAAGEVEDWFNFTIPNFTYSGAVDDLVIAYQVAPIDGVNGILGQSGPIYTRGGAITYSSITSSTDLPYTAENDTSSSYFTTISGIMQFDVADVQRMIDSGTFYNVVLHEMGHVIGIGSTWSAAECASCYPISSSTYKSFEGSNHYDPTGACPHATAAFANLTSAYLQVETQGGFGTACAHWDEQQLNNELMTGYVEVGTKSMPISIMTVGSLEDLGYVVDYSAADYYALPNSSTSTSTSSSSTGPSANRRLVDEPRQQNQEDDTENSAPKKREFLDLTNDILPFEAIRLPPSARGGHL